MNLDPSYPQSSEFRESASPQDVHVELVRHYADVLRMLTDRICSPPSVSAPARPIPEDPPPSVEVVESAPASCSDWESAASLLRTRSWDTETIVHLWLQPSYVLGLHLLVGIGVNLQGHRRIVNVTECGPQDQSGMEAVLDDLSMRGLRSGLLVTLPGNVALRAAVGGVWGSRVRVQRCLNTVMDEMLSGLDPEQALEFRHRLQQSWQLCDASEAQTSLEQVTHELTKVNRSSGRVLERALESTLTLQRTGLLLRTDRGLRVLNSLKTVLTRAGRSLVEVPIQQHGLRLCAAMLDLEPKLRRVRHSTYLLQFHTNLKTPSIPSSHV